MSLVSDIRTIVERDWPGLLMASIVGGTLAIVVTLMLSYRSDAVEMRLKIDDVRHQLAHNREAILANRQLLADIQRRLDEHQ